MLFQCDVNADTLAKIREAVNAGCVLGSQAFAAEASALAGQPVRNSRRGRPPKETNAVEGGVSGKLL
jgi:hypothetical protein